MHLIQSIKLRSTARDTMIILAAIMLGTVVATDALAAGRGGGGGGHAGGFGVGHITRGFHGPLLDRAPSSTPHFNSSSPYTVPQSPETPVSPASPGSIFGNG
jgi:hypothetical protein